METICAGGSGSGEVVRDLLERLGDKWTLLVVGMLGDGPVRYTHLLKKIPGISQRMLTLTLKKLERDGLASRKSFAEIPPRVEYTLTDLGMSLIPPAVAFALWARTHAEEIQQRREEYDKLSD
jgi:DNA-binding HxlR family transcriptional regulator